MKNSKNRQVFCGGYCGSGTRAIQFLLKKAGFFGGDLIGVQQDYIPLGSYKANLILDKKVNYFTDHKEYLEKLFASWWGKYDRWSIKHGFLMLAIPAILDTFPEAKMIVVVRHGIDNILNQHQMDRDIGEFWRKDIIEQNEDLLTRRAKFWNAVHDKVRRDMMIYPDRTMWVKLEDLVTNKVEETQKILDFLEIDTDAVKCSSVLKKPKSIGRRKKKLLVPNINYPYFPEDDRERLYNEAREMLGYFDYDV